MNNTIPYTLYTNDKNDIYVVDNDMVAVVCLHDFSPSDHFLLDADHIDMDEFIECTNYSIARDTAHHSWTIERDGHVWEDASTYLLMVAIRLGMNN